MKDMDGIIHDDPDGTRSDHDSPRIQVDADETHEPKNHDNRSDVGKCNNKKKR